MPVAHGFALQVSAAKVRSSSGSSRGKATRCAAAVLDEHAQAEDAPSPLSNLLVWCLANGVRGIGTAESKLALYEGLDGERGMLCVDDVQAGEDLLLVPLALALTDHPEDEESNALLYEGAPWSVRLAAKLLREKAKGDTSPWHPYIQTLPETVPAPLIVMSWEEMQEIELPAALAALYEHDWLVTDSYGRCSSDALGDASEEDFKWAMSIVHSRTFGTAARKGGVGVRMLLPLVDMFNHGGDEAVLLDQAPVQPGNLQAAVAPPPARQVFASDNVRWDLRPPSDVASGSWSLVTTATADVARDEALLFSYGERPNLDFFLHYGFVPRSNPHEAVVLFGGLAEALEWHAQQYAGVQSINDLDSEAQALYARAFEAGQREQQEQRQQQERPQGEQPPTASTSGHNETSGKAQLELLNGGSVGAPLVAAFAALHSSSPGRAAEAAAMAAIAARCWQLLGSFSPLLRDLSALLLDAAGRGEDDQEQYYAERLQYYWKAIMPAYEAAPSRLPVPALGSDATTSSSTNTSSSSSMSLSSSTAAGAGGHHGALALAMLQHYGKDAGTAEALSSGKRLAHSYRVEQKMVLWDAILAAQVPLQVLEQSAGRRPSAAAAS